MRDRRRDANTVNGFQRRDTRAMSAPRPWVGEWGAVHAPDPYCGQFHDEYQFRWFTTEVGARRFGGDHAREQHLRRGSGCGERGSVEFELRSRNAEHDRRRGLRPNYDDGNGDTSTSGSTYPDKSIVEPSAAGSIVLAGGHSRANCIACLVATETNIPIHVDNTPRGSRCRHCDPAPSCEMQPSPTGRTENLASLTGLRGDRRCRTPSRIRRAGFWRHTESSIRTHEAQEAPRPPVLRPLVDAA